MSVSHAPRDNIMLEQDQNNEVMHFCSTCSHNSCIVAVFPFKQCVKSAQVGFKITQYQI